MNGEAIEVSGTYRLQDFLRFRMYGGLRFIWPVILLLAAVSVVGLVILVVGEGQYRGSAAEVAVVPVFWVALLVVPQYFAARRQFNLQAYLKEPVNFRFDAEGMHSRSGVGTGNVSWQAFYKARETGSLFILYPAPNLGHLLPKRFFKDAEEMARFRETVEIGMAPKRIARPGVWSRWW